MNKVSQTQLFNVHKQLGGKMVEFAKHMLPIQYKDRGIIKEHIAVRDECGIFDVSHMRQVIFRTDTQANLQKLAEKLLVSSYSVKPVGQAFLTLLLTKKGQIVDDIVATKREDSLRLILNAGNADNDIKHIREVISDNEMENIVKIEELPNSLLALQGPQAINIMKDLFNLELSHIKFMMEEQHQLKNLNETISITRCGYTGEDGFEISIKDNTEKFFDILYQSGRVSPAGLGARDTLRMEGGFCLNGNDIKPFVDFPNDVNMQWTVRKKGKFKFNGQQAVMDYMAQNPPKKLQGIVLDEKICRENCQVFNNAQEPIGITTSGGFSPSLEKGIAIASVDGTKATEELFVEVRKKLIKAKAIKMPFVKHNYVR